MISVEHMDELITRFKSGELDIRDIIEQSYFEGESDGARKFADRLKSDAENGTGDIEKLLGDCLSLSNSNATFLYVNYIDEVLAEWQKGEENE